MFSMKPRYFPKIVKLMNKIHSNERYNFHLQNQNLTPLAYIYTLNKFQKESVHKSSLHHYSTIEIPPPPPPESDVFGSLGGLKYENVDLDPEELKEEIRLQNVRANVPRKLKPSRGEYAAIIKKYVERGDLKRAEEVMHLCKRNNDKPTPYMYTLLIRAFAVQGDLQKVYKYYSEMKSRQFKISENVFTSLFNACANSPDSKALVYLERVKEYMAKIDCPMNHAHYNVIVKALGRHGKFDEARRLVQTMMDNKLKIGVSTLNSLMYAANSNIESGLKDVLHIWQLMRKLKVPPDVFTYHLLLRAIRDTHFGGCTIQELFLADENSELITDGNRPDLLVYPPIVSPLPFEHIHKKPKVSGLIGSSELKSSELDSTETSATNTTRALKNNSQILPESIATLDLDAILKQNKLILFGGVEGFLEKMKNDRIEPTVKTVTYLMELVPDSTAAENEIIKYAKSKKISLDIDFYNMLIKKRALRSNKKDAKEVLNDIHLNDLKPNVVTYGVLALTCSTANESRDLLKALKATNQPLNKYIADALLNSAFLRRDFSFILELMERMLFQQVRLDEDTYEKLDKFQQNMSELIKRKDKRSKTESFKIGFSKFNMRYKKWQEEMGRKIITERLSNKRN